MENMIHNLSTEEAKEIYGGGLEVRYILVNGSIEVTYVYVPDVKS